MGHQNGKLFPATDSVISDLVSTPTKKSPEKKLEREKSTDSGEAGENVLFALPEQPKSKPYMRHMSNVSVTSGDSGYHDNLINNQKAPSQTLTAGGDATAVTHEEKIDIGIDIDKDADTHEQAQSLDKNHTHEGTQSPDSALSDEQRSPRLGESKPDRSNMKLDLPPSPLNRQLSKSPSEPALKLSQKDYSYVSRSNAGTPG